jgi:hypothetical protein
VCQTSCLYRRRYRVTTVCAAPSVLHQVAQRALALYPTATASGSGPCSSLLRVLCSEEPLTPSKAQAISMAMPRAELHYIFRATDACPGECIQPLFCLA